MRRAERNRTRRRTPWLSSCGSTPRTGGAAAARGAHRAAPPHALAERLRPDSARVARAAGAVAATPFLVALVPGYLNSPWQETRMLLRTAALSGRAPATSRTAAETLAL